MIDNDICEVISTLYHDIKQKRNKGAIASYIPELSKIDENKFGIHISTISDENYDIGDYQEKFSIQSIAKVISLTLAVRFLGKKLWNRVGVEPSGGAFNSLILLETEQGIPRNPFLNSGALVVCDVLLSHLQKPKHDLLAFVRELADSEDIHYSEKVAQSEKVTSYRNIAVCNFIKSFGNIENSPEAVLDLYYYLCSIEMNCKELSHTFLYLANGGKKTSDNTRILSKSKTKRLNALMQTCGFYDQSGDFSFKVGLPGKSGVGGGIVAIYPGEYSIAVWSPPLNKKGNSHKGMKFLEKFTTQTTSIF